MTSDVKCLHCGKELDSSHTGRCPYCGQTGKAVTKTAIVSLGLKVSVSATKTSTKTSTYFERNRKKLGFHITILTMDIIFATIASVVPYIIGDIKGMLIGLLGISLPTILISNIYLYVRTKDTVREIVKEITRISGDS